MKFLLFPNLARSPKQLRLLFSVESLIRIRREFPRGTARLVEGLINDRIREVFT